MSRFSYTAQLYNYSTNYYLNFIKKKKKSIILSEY